MGRQIEAVEGAVRYESPDSRIRYRVDETRTYTPDFILANGILIETKGRFTAEDRKKHRLIREQAPWWDIRFVFYNANNRLSKRSKTTYGQWCDKYHFLWANKWIPDEWFDELPKEGACQSKPTRQ